jgi:hypothetical protein
MTNYQALPIIIPVDERDQITHTAEWPQCKDATCPCQDEIILSMPTEEELDAQERSVLSQAEDEGATSGPRRIDWDAILN